MKKILRKIDMDSSKVLLLTLFCINLLCVSTYNNEGTLDIAAFNVQVFGIRKMKNSNVRRYLKEIILRYDLILIQEIRDISGEAINQLFSDVKEVNPNYAIKLSDRLGRSSSKEQYAYIYRTDWLIAVDDFTYADTNDVFEREPYIVRFKSDRAAINDFAVAGIHVDPDDAQNEMSNLPAVYDDIVSRWSLNDVIIMGDFNAGCNYVKDWKNINLATDSRFYWLLDNSEDTTTKFTDCPYDRVVVAGNNLLSSIIPLSPAVFRFDELYPLTQDQVEDVSDHFPVQFQIRSLFEKDNLISSKSISFIDRSLTGITSSKIYAMRKKAISLGTYQIFCTYTKSGRYLKITVWKEVSSVSDVMASLGDFHKDFPDFITINDIYTIERVTYETRPLRFLPRGRGLYKTLYDYLKGNQQEYAIKLECSLVDRRNPVCYLQIKQL